MTSNEEKIHDLCSSAAKDINLCRVAYSVIDDAPEEEKPALFEAFAIGYKTTPSDQSLKLPRFIDTAQKKQLLRKYGHQVDRMALQELSLSERDYYDQLWKYISALPTLKACVVALYDCVIDVHLPYFSLDRGAALSMDQDKYEALIASIGPKNLCRMKFILNSSGFTQKTEQASLVAAMMDQLKSFEERAVFLAQVISHFKSNLNRAEMRELARLIDTSGIPGSPFGGGDDEDEDDEDEDDEDEDDEDEDAEGVGDIDIDGLFDDDGSDHSEETDDPGDPVF